MATTYFLAPAPKWYFFDSDGRLAANGTMETYSSQDHTLPKAVYSDSGGSFPYSNPIVLDGTGGTPVPIYWKDDGTSDRYYVVVKDKDGQIIFTIDNYPISGAGGGGGSVTNLVDIENQIINGQFHLINNTIFGGVATYSNTILTALNPVPEGTSRMAPGGGTVDSLRDGGYISGSLVDTSGKSVNTAAISPKDITGWVFIKQGGASLDDTISFPAAPPGTGLPGGPSANAPRFFEYSSSNSFAATELDLTYIIGDVRALSGETIQVGFDAWCSGAAPDGEFFIEQYFGTGGVPSATVTPAGQPFTFPNATWDRLVFSFSVPSITGKTLGTNGDHNLKLRWRIPSNNLFIYRMTNFQVTIGATVITDFIYETFNETAHQVLAELIHGHLPKTGDVKFSVSPVATSGWIVLNNNNATLGSNASSPTFGGEEVRNLYRLIYNNYDDTMAPVTSGRGANADADFDANKTMRFPSWIGRAFSPAGTAIGGVPSQAIGSTAYSNPTHTLTIAEMPSHTHLGSSTTEFGVGAPVGAFNSNDGLNNLGHRWTTDPSGGNQPHNIMQPTAYIYLHVKL